MSFDRLSAFGKKVASELIQAGTPNTPTEAKIAGWRFDSLDTQETSLYGPGMNTELLFESDEMWLGIDGRLWVVQVKKSTVLGRGIGNDSNRSIYFAIVPLTEDYARSRDGKSVWYSWVDRRGGGAKADMRTLQFRPPSATYPPCATVSSLLGKIRPK